MPFKSQAQRRKFAQLLVEGQDLEPDVRRVEPRDRQQAPSRAGRRQEEGVEKEAQRETAPKAEVVDVASASRRVEHVRNWLQRLILSEREDDDHRDETGCREHQQSTGELPVESLIQPMAYGPAKPARLPIELISAIPPAADVPDRNAVGSVQKTGMLPKMPKPATEKAIIFMTGSSRWLRPNARRRPAAGTPGGIDVPACDPIASPTRRY